MPNNNNQKIDAFFRAMQGRINSSLAGLPPIVGNMVVNNALDNFKKQAFDGKPWKDRQTKSKRGNGKQNILVKSGALRRSIRVIRSTATSVSVGSDLPYAGVHNDGGEINRTERSETFVRNRYTKGAKGKMFGGMGAFKKGTTAGRGLSFKAYSFKMPQRRFLGRSPSLDAAIKKTVKSHILNALKTR